MENKPRVLIIGLDGGCWDVLLPLVEKGIMPNLGEIMGSSTWGMLTSTIPPVTAPAWTSFITGKSPDYHGIFDFMLKKGWGGKLVNSREVKSGTLWSLLSENNRKVGVINVPMTYPALPINGFMLSGVLTPRIGPGFCYPPDLYERIREKVGEYIIAVPWRKYRRRQKEFINHLLHCHSQREKYALYLMKKYDWDLFMVTFGGTDWIQHALWEEIIQAIEGKDSPLHTHILEFYRRLDDTLGKINREKGAHTTLFIISDHGFGPLKKKVFINRWLWKEGFLSVNWQKLFSLKTLLRLLTCLDFLKIRKVIFPQKQTSLFARKAFYNIFFNCINWDKTLAYTSSNTEQGIYINLKGREPKGIVSPGSEYENLREKIIRRLREFKDPEDGKEVASRIYKREELYQGPFVENAPDIIFFLREGEYLGDITLTRKSFLPRNSLTGSGTHRLEGIFLAQGEHIREKKMCRARIIDVVPTILYLMGIPVPRDMNGKVLEDIFSPSFLQSHTPQIYRERREITKEEKGGEGLTPEEEKDVRERLKGLGYID